MSGQTRSTSRSVTQRTAAYGVAIADFTAPIGIPNDAITADSRKTDVETAIALITVSIIARLARRSIGVSVTANRDLR